jgi:hypothetical protein
MFSIRTLACLSRISASSVLSARAFGHSRRALRPKDLALETLNSKATHSGSSGRALFAKLRVLFSLHPRKDFKMKTIKRASLVLLFLAYSWFLVLVGAQSGGNTVYNKLLWLNLNRTVALPIITNPAERKAIYQAERKGFAAQSAGDLE